MLRLTGSGSIKTAVRRHLAERDDLRGRRVIDLPAGSGVNAAELHRAGATVEAFDLFPEFFDATGLECRPTDLRDRLPIEDGHADLVLFQEAIEHLADPLFALRELNRILKPGGRLLLTTPNVSHLRARVSHLLLESDLYNRLPPDTHEAIWFEKDGRDYHGHLFLIGAARLWTLTRVAGFRLRRILPVKASATSLLLLPLAYPWLVAATGYAWWRTRARQRRAGVADLGDARALARLNLHPTVLAGKHVFWELVKERDAGERPAVVKDRAEIL